MSTSSTLNGSPPGVVQSLPGARTAVLQDDRRPSGPDVEREFHRAGVHRIIAAGLRDRRQLLARLEDVFLDGGRHVRVGGLHAGGGGQLILGDRSGSRRLVLGEKHPAESIGDKAEDDTGKDDEKQRFGAGFITHNPGRLIGRYQQFKQSLHEWKNPPAFQRCHRSGMVSGRFAKSSPARWPFLDLGRDPQTLRPQ